MHEDLPDFRLPPTVSTADRPESEAKHIPRGPIIAWQGKINTGGQYGAKRIPATARVVVESFQNVDPENAAAAANTREISMFSEVLSRDSMGAAAWVPAEPEDHQAILRLIFEEHLLAF